MNKRVGTSTCRIAKMLSRVPPLFAQITHSTCATTVHVCHHRARLTQPQDQACNLCLGHDIVLNGSTLTAKRVKKAPVLPRF